MSRTYDILGKVGDEQAFRQEIREWLAECTPKNWRCSILIPARPCNGMRRCPMTCAS